MVKHAIKLTFNYDMMFEVIGVIVRLQRSHFFSVLNAYLMMR